MADSSSPGSFTLFRVAGIPINFHFTFLLLILILFWGGVVGGGDSVHDALLIVGLFVSVLLHELGHALTALHFGVRIVSITMYPVGGAARLASQPSPWQELWITAAGPATNVVIAAVLWPASQALDGSTAGLIRQLAISNIGLALFNLVPAFPMDGGRLLRAGLALSGRSEIQATRIATNVGRVVAVLMGIYGALNGQWFLLIIAFMVFSGAQQERIVAESRVLSTGVPVRDAMIVDFRTLPHGATLNEAAKMLIDTSQQDFPVVHGEEVIGLLGRTALINAMSQQGGDAYIASVMNREFVRLPPELDLSDALPRMQQAGPCALVMEGSRLLGLLTLENIGEFFALRAARRPA
jgi:Zn-dependent protease/CBS domain-containing protein